MTETNEVDSPETLQLSRQDVRRLLELVGEDEQLKAFGSEPDAMIDLFLNAAYVMMLSTGQCIACLATDAVLTEDWKHLENDPNWSVIKERLSALSTLMEEENENGLQTASDGQAS